MTGALAVARAPATRHFKVLDGLRGVAAIAVVAYHFGGRSNLPGLMPRGYLAVDFFFVLSGFVLAHAYLRRLEGAMSTKQFLLQRWIRLWPMLVPGTLFGAAIEIWRPNAGNPATHAAQVAVAAVLGSFAVPLPFATSMEKTIFPINGPIWSLFFEIAANVAFVFVAKSRRIHLSAVTLAAMGGIGIVLWAMASGTANIGPYLGDWPGGFPRVAYSFFVGALLSGVVPGRLTLPAWTYPLALVAVMMLPVTTGPLNVAIDLAVILVLFPLIVYSAAQSQVGATASRLYDVAGELSYPIYAIHYPIIRAICFALTKHPEPVPVRLGLAAASIVFVSGVAWAALRFYDRPMRRFLTRRFVMVPGDSRPRPNDVGAAPLRSPASPS